MDIFIPFVLFRQYFYNFKINLQFFQNFVEKFWKLNIFLVDVHSIGIPVSTNESITNNSIEEAYKKLKIKILDLDAETTKIKKDKKKLTSRLEESQKQCKNLQAEILQYKNAAEKMGIDVEQVKSGKIMKPTKGNPDSQSTIEELKKMVVELEDTNTKLHQKNIELSQNSFNPM